MKKVTFASALILLASLFPVSNASAASDYSQISPLDTSTPAGIDPSFDINRLQIWLSSDETIRFTFQTAAKVTADKVDDSGLFVLAIDSNGDGATDFGLNNLGTSIDNESSVEIDLNEFTSDGESDTVYGCTADAWIDDDGYVAYEIKVSCLNLASNFKVRAMALPMSANGGQMDSLPDSPQWLTFSSNYIASQKCASAYKNTKIKYLGVQYICTQVSGKWKYTDYGPIAAAKSKYLTEKAYYICHLNMKVIGVTLSDGGKTLQMSGVGKYFVDYSDYLCASKVLGMPSSVQSQVGITRALDGMQKAKWGKINAFWTYHPDNGLNMTFTYN